jgi:hypothetical protein
MRSWKIWLVLTAIGLAGCGGGGSGGSAAPVAEAPQDETGSVAITITDAEGDFDTYTVDVTSVVLQRGDGTVVETLPLATRIDFAELTEISEFLTIATVPAGRYDSASLTLDFSTAEIVVQDENGDLHPARPVDESGAALGSVTVRLRLAEADNLVIRPGVPAAFSLDFDLDASNTIDLSGSPVTVTVMPFLLASAELERDRAHRLRGMLAEVDQAAQTVAVNVRPFRHRSGRFGTFSFGTDSGTLYEINGTGYVGADGLAALADLEGLVPLVAGGRIQAGQFLAETVLAGTSVPWTSSDAVTGAVIARDGDTLTVSGAVIEYRDGALRRDRAVSVVLGDDTRVTALGLPGDTLGIDSVSVGQRIVAFGEMTDDVTLDATDGHVRMQISGLTGTVVATGSLAVDLAFLNGRRPAAFDFSGTGTDAAHDADPSFYEIDTATLPLGSVEEGDPVRVLGHVNAWGSAPADFLARTVIDVSLDHRAAVFVAGWPEPTGNPLVTADPAGLTLNLEAARALLKVRGIPVRLINPLTSLLLAAPPDGRGVYAVAVRGTGEIHQYRSFADLVDEVIDQLDRGRLLRHAAAQGRYNQASESLSTGRAGFEFVVPGA